MKNIKTLGELKTSGYVSKTLKEELRDNLISSLREKKNLFSDIKGYEDTVIPQLESALLAKHNILFLGLRGQAKTRMARLMTRLMDEYIPAIAGSEIHEDPFAPMTRKSYDLIKEKGDDTPIEWIHSSKRYFEKLATPDVSVSDLIGDIDPIKAANLKLDFSDERVIHYGMIPRANRCIFVLNELPDLQARIQVALFNILQEGDIQIRGFNVRLPLDIQFVFTANPEDYTNRGSIVTPLKDRIEAQILTHYPSSLEVAKAITAQEINLSESQKTQIEIPILLHDLIENIAFVARDSEYIDQKSGVSARLTISAFENMVAVAERRLLVNAETSTSTRITDLYSILSSITGKVELVYEGELEGASNVAQYLIGKAIREQFKAIFPDPELIKKNKEIANPYTDLIDWFNNGNKLELLKTENKENYEQKLDAVPGLKELVLTHVKNIDKNETYLMMEFALYGLTEFSQLSKHQLVGGVEFKDLMSSMIDLDNFNFDEE